jgi:hypothetical protein
MSAIRWRGYRRGGEVIVLVRGGFQSPADERQQRAGPSDDHNRPPRKRASAEPAVQEDRCDDHAGCQALEPVWGQEEGSE